MTHTKLRALFFSLFAENSISLKDLMLLTKQSDAFRFQFILNRLDILLSRLPASRTGTHPGATMIVRAYIFRIIPVYLSDSGIEENWKTLVWMVGMGMGFEQECRTRSCASTSV